jgi:hypothetical protein
MQSHRDFRASLLFAGLYLGVCIFPAVIASVCLGLWALWKGLNGDILYVVGGAAAIFIGPPLAALFVGLLCLGGAVVSGLLFLLVSPLFRQINSHVSRVLFLCCGSLVGLGGGMLGIGFLYSGTLKPVSEWSIPVSLVYGLATSCLYLYYHRDFIDSKYAQV